LKSGNERIKFCSMNRPHVKEWPEVTLAVWKEARKQGFEVTYINHKIPSTGHINTFSRRLLINGHICQIKRSTTVHDSSKYGQGYTKYVHVNFRNVEGIQFFILVAKVNEDTRFYIIPKGMIIQVAGKDKNIFIPVDGYSNYLHKFPPKLNWVACRDAWHQLEEVLCQQTTESTLQSSPTATE